MKKSRPKCLLFLSLLNFNSYDTEKEWDSMGGFYFFGSLILVFLLGLSLLSFGVYKLWKLFVKTKK